MTKLGFAILCLIGLYMYLDGTGAGEAAAMLVGFAAFYVAITAVLLRE